MEGESVKEGGVGPLHHRDLASQAAIQHRTDASVELRGDTALALCVFLSPHPTDLLLRNMMCTFAGQSRAQ